MPFHEKENNRKVNCHCSPGEVEDKILIALKRKKVAWQAENLARLNVSHLTLQLQSWLARWAGMEFAIRQ